MRTVIKRPPFDEFTFRLFNGACNRAKVPHDGIYLWSTVIEPWHRQSVLVNDEWQTAEEVDFRYEIYRSINEPLVILAIKDHLTLGNFNPFAENLPLMCQYINDLADFHGEKTIILLTSMENLGAYVSRPNISIVPWGGDITNQQTAYSQLDPVFDKNIASQTSYVFLNRNKRSHRVTALSLLFGHGLERTGMMSCMFRDEIDDLNEYLKWEFNERQLEIKETMEKGWNSCSKHPWFLGDGRGIYPNLQNDNVTNFNNKLRSYYSYSFVEIIGETSGAEKAFLLTEKTLNSIYGCNFPIWISSPGVVRTMREIGFDVFDDIIDHRYDLLENPIDRFSSAIRSNRAILSDPDHAKRAWLANRERFERNIDTARTKMYAFFESRFKTGFSHAYERYLQNG